MHCCIPITLRVIMVPVVSSGIMFQGVSNNGRWSGRVLPLLPTYLPSNIWNSIYCTEFRVRSTSARFFVSAGIGIRHQLGCLVVHICTVDLPCYTTPYTSLYIMWLLHGLSKGCTVINHGVNGLAIVWSALHDYLFFVQSNYYGVLLTYSRQNWYPFDVRIG